jgi:hypothetical protein
LLSTTPLILDILDMGVHFLASFEGWNVFVSSSLFRADQDSVQLIARRIQRWGKLDYGQAADAPSSAEVALVDGVGHPARHRRSCQALRGAAQSDAAARLQ